MLHAEESAWGSGSIEEDGDASRPRRWLLWSASVSVAWLVFELTANPALAVGVGSLKPTLSAIGAAGRGARHESNRARRIAEALFQIAWGIWQSTAIALGLMVGIAFGASLLETFVGVPAPREAPVEFMTAGLIMLSGAGSATLVTMAAIVVARRGRVQVWVGRSRNRVPLIAMLGLLVGIFTVSVAVCWLPLVSPPDAAWWIPSILAVEVLYFCVVLPIIVLWGRDAMVIRITARRPGEMSGVDLRDPEAT
ncbi:hypothetical protein AB1L88_05100 [Tautonia sp. JC769]|uniref:hypothetical protein n=1 Tax=Tautonia sp. JC769 TaxID=3232135 RepID=UPI0034595101